MVGKGLALVAVLKRLNKEIMQMKQKGKKVTCLVVLLLFVTDIFHVGEIPASNQIPGYYSQLDSDLNGIYRSAGGNYSNPTVT